MKKLFVTLLALVMLVNMSVFAIEPIHTEEMEIASFLNENEISLSLVNELKDVYDATKNEGEVVIGSFENTIVEVKKMAETYDFSREEIEDYIRGIISTPTAIIGPPEIPDFAETAATSIPQSDRIGDDGIGYEVKSNTGYVKQSAYLTLPDVSINRKNSTGFQDATSAYMFYTFESGHAIDVGLWYHYGAGGWGWRDTYLRSFAYEQDEEGNYIYDDDGNPIKEQSKTYSGLLGVSAGDYLFMEAGIVYANDGQRYIQCRILNGDDLSDVISDFSVWVGNYINSTAIIDRQITMCNSFLNFNTGEYIEGAEFSGARIFTPTSSVGSLINSNYVNADYCGRFGINGNDYKQVKVNNHNEWNMENINIYFSTSQQNIGE